MIPPVSHLGKLSVANFLQNYWQQKSLLIRQAIPDMLPVISAEELAGLSLGEVVESRLIENKGTPSQWRVKYGPLLENDFSIKRDHPWTLLVQGVDTYVPAAFEFLAKFRFIPAWRLDDLMVSYATEGAGVGAHFDRYDVFLIQGEGRRRWQLGQVCDEHSRLLDHPDICLLEDFQEQSSYDLEPGDLLYVPPLVAHKGVALTPKCMTYSIGFRAPSHGELLSDFANYIYNLSSPDKRLQNAPKSNCAAEISAADIASIKGIFEQYMTPELIADWFGRYSSQANTENHLPSPPEEPLELAELDALLEQSYRLCRVTEEAIMLYSQTDAHSVKLYLGGESFVCTEATAHLVMCLANSLVISIQQLRNLLADRKSKELFIYLYNQGWVYFDET